MSENTENKDNDIEAMEAALHKANEEAKNYRLQNKNLKDENKSLKEQAGFKDKYLESEAKLKLNGMGIKNPERFIKFLDLSDVTLDDEGNVEGLSEKVEALEEDFPEIFDPLKQAGDVDADNKEPSTHEPTASETLAKQLLKG